MEVHCFCSSGVVVELEFVWKWRSCGSEVFVEGQHVWKWSFCGSAVCVEGQFRVEVSCCVFLPRLFEFNTSVLLIHFPLLCFITERKMIHVALPLV